MPRRHRALAASIPCLALLATAGALTVGCGAKTGLGVPTKHDAATVTDAAFDAGPDVQEADVEDVPEIIDVPPTLDIAPPPEVTPFCSDPSITQIYVVTEDNELLAFQPPTLSFTPVGTINCPAKAGYTPFSMAVDHLGTAYVVFNDGELFEVSVKDASCKPTSYVTKGGSFLTFGMGFARETDGSEKLYIATTGATPTLANIDIPALTVTTIAPLDPNVMSAELTGTGAGQLFGFFANGAGVGSSIAEIDKKLGTITGRADLPSVTQGSGWAFAFWGGDFYTFTAPDRATTTVTRYSPKTGAVDNVASWPHIIVGAGVSTCAPG
jgi:hypothetical protein